MIFDTNAFSDLLAGVSGLRPFLEQSGPYHFPVVAIGEYRHGLNKSVYRNALSPKFEEFLSLGTILPVTDTTARHYGEIAAEQDRKGRPVPSNDLWLAALAREHDLPILTRDRHFLSIDGIQVLSWDH